MKKIINKKGEVFYEFIGKIEVVWFFGVWNGWDVEKIINVKNDGDKIGELCIGFDENDKLDKQNSILIFFFYLFQENYLFIEQYMVINYKKFNFNCFYFLRYLQDVLL